ncbi:acyl-CoA dehydrogenase [Metabacillus fastidiosus]|uniref:acyl-CoA dehydrogenase n=1 Tax=Metabacillus fastidiosus TaxID=1458 RepID=UPI002DC02562|nr:acyl-CoA dehydrogenase [Metabacillus fastidiosus]MEC2075986.1 acyl-CoA dehydrogenase [Metabacillus fastidiosus]
MDFHFTEQQQIIRQMVRGFAEKEVAPFVERMENGEFPREIIKKMGSLGLMGIPISEKYSGAGLDFISYIIAIHEISKVSAALGVILSVHTSVGTNPIYNFGTEEQRRKYIPKLAAGEYLGAFCLTEPGAGSDAGSLKMRAVKKDDHYILNGSKVFITNGCEADTYIVFASTNPERKSNGISAFIVEKNTKGLVIGKNERKMGLNGSKTVQLIFENVEVPVENLLGKENKGFQIALANLDAGRIGISAQSLGIAESALQYAITYTKERKQFGKIIAAYQGIGFKLADMATQVEAAALLTYQAAFLKEKNNSCTKEAAMAKLFASRAAMEVTTEAIQIYGGYGYTKDYPVERMFRDAKVCEIYEGTSEIQKIVINKHLTKGM